MGVDAGRATKGVAGELGLHCGQHVVDSVVAGAIDRRIEQVPVGRPDVLDQGKPAIGIRLAVRLEVGVDARLDTGSDGVQVIHGKAPCLVGETTVRRILNRSHYLSGNAVCGSTPSCTAMRPSARGAPKLLQELAVQDEDRARLGR